MGDMGPSGSGVSEMTIGTQDKVRKRKGENSYNNKQNHYCCLDSAE
jgi:hypothetical protein